MDRVEKPKESTFSPYANSKELWYRNVEQPREERYASPEGWVRKIRESGRLSLLPYLEREAGVLLKGSILEVGAGSCWLSAELSKRPQVKEIVALDFSEHLLNQIAPSVIEALGGFSQKIERRLGDMHALPWETDRFDFVFTDSTLHHSAFPLKVLGEVYRVLKEGGVCICLREPFKVPLEWLKPEHPDKVRVERLGVVEQHLYRDQYKEYFSLAGFQPKFLPVTFSRGLKARLSRWVNPWLKGDYCIVAQKVHRREFNQQTHAIG